VGLNPFILESIENFKNSRFNFRQDIDLLKNCFGSTEAIAGEEEHRYDEGQKSLNKLCDKIEVIIKDENEKEKISNIYENVKLKNLYKVALSKRIDNDNKYFNCIFNFNKKIKRMYKIDCMTRKIKV
jgi:hypothetical protein